MNWFRNWKIRTKILSLIILIALFVGSVGFVGYYYSTKANVQMTDMFSNNLLAVKYLNDARAQGRAAESATYHFLLTTDKDSQKKKRDDIKIRADNFDRDYSAYMKTPLVSYEQERVQKIQAELITYRAGLQMALDIANQGDPTGAFDYYLNNVDSHLESINTALEELADFEAKQANNTNSINDVDYAVSVKLIIGISMAASLLCLLLGFSVTIPISNLSHRSYHDSLTGLPNRVSMNESISKLISLHHKFAILYLDLDNFKHINDALGHSKGDILLKKIGLHLQSVVGSTDIVARLGGDEYMIILKEIKDREIVVGIAQQIIDSFRTSIKLNDYELIVSTSIGIVLYPDDGEDMESLVKNSDIAMYEAKKQGRNRYCFSKGINDNEVINRLKLISHLHMALERDEFRLYFQPKFDITNLTTTGGEVLLRWFHPEMGLVLPGSFISLAEETGLIIPIGEWIIKNSFQQIKVWSDHYNLGNIRISINLSPLQFLQNNLIFFIKDCLNETKLETKYIEIEITESIALQNSEATLSKLRQIKDLGIEISMDDFGTGYSSMSYLSKYPIDALKIDISFVRELAKNKENQAIVTAIIDMAHSLNLKVIAEGVETEEQLQILRVKKCDFGQGHLFGRPMPASDFEEKFINGLKIINSPRSELT